MVMKALKATGGEHHQHAASELCADVAIPQHATEESKLSQLLGQSQLEHAAETRFDGQDSLPLKGDLEFDTDLGKIFVKQSAAKRLSPNLLPILRKYQGEGFASIFNSEMELELQVQQKYERCSIQLPRKWPATLDAAVKAQLDEYHRAGLIRELLPGESALGKAQLNIVTGNNMRLRATMDAREINKFFCPPPFKLPSVLNVLGNRGPKFYCKLDFADAYMHVRFTDKFAQWFTFEYGGKNFLWKHMGFGWNMAPHIF
jgi:hypothetical protein